jgi:hypothetical protein
MNALNRHSCRKCFFIIVLIVCILPLGLHAQNRPPVGRKFQVNSYQTGNQSEPSAAALRNGGFVICWQGQERVGKCYDIFGKIFSSRWNEVGDEFTVNTVTESDQFNPAVAVLDDSSFVVCWISNKKDDSRYRVFGQRFSYDGKRLGPEFQVNTTMFIGPMNPTIVVLTNGNFVVCWEMSDFYGQPVRLLGQLMSTNGEKTGDEFQLKDNKQKAVVLPLAAGEFVIFSIQWETDKISLDVVGQCFDSNGQKKGDPFPVGKDMTGNQDRPEGTVLRSGQLAICCNDIKSNRQLYLKVRLFSRDGQSRGEGVTVNSDTLAYPLNRCISPLSDGTFVVLWDDSRYSGINGQLFNVNAEKIGEKFDVYPSPPGYQSAPTAVPLSDGGFLVCWNDCGEGESFPKMRGQFFSATAEKRNGALFFDFHNRIDYMQPRLVPLMNDNFIILGIESFGMGGDVDVYSQLFRESPFVHRLSKFHLVHPKHDETLKTTSVTFNWQQPSSFPVCYPQELHYQVVWDLRPDFSSPDAETEEVDMDTSITPTLDAGKTYFWKVLARNIAGDSLWSSETHGFYIHHLASADNHNNDAEAPGRLILNPNFPNPFNSSTVIRYELKARSRNRLRIYDIHGRMVLESIRGWENAGAHQYRWEGDDSSGRPLPSGLYVCLLQSESEDQPPASRSQKISLIR